MTTLAPASHAVARSHRPVPWSPRAWAQAVYLFAAIPAQLLAVIIPAILLGWLASLHLAAARHGGLTWTLGKWWYLAAWFAALLVLIFALPALTGIQRHRLRVTAGVDIPPQPAPLESLSVRGIVVAVRSGATWRQLGYHLVAGPALAAAGVAALGVWLAGVLYSLVYGYAWALPQSGLLWRGQGSGGPGTNLPTMLYIPIDVYLTAVGVVLLAAAPWLTRAVAALDARAARSLLGPSRTEELEHRVEHLAQTRAGVVDAADAERRRLERDLHDGTQQRLVALAMNLGMARAEASTVEHAQQAIAEAHEDAKAALTELRNLIRGLHPAVLEDRGLDAALSGVAARMPVPVRLTVDLPRRPPPVVEAVAYFVVSEALANVAKHAQASQAQVFVQRAGDRLHIIVSDDGVGGADPSRGSGLAGLAKRASSVDGTFEIASPSGGPTLLTVDLPCAR